MQCPVDGEVLVIAERSGVEIDYCPRCRGVWLDRGELDKIIERGQNRAAPRQDPRHDRYEDRRDHRHDDHRDRDRDGFLSDIFDFF